MSEDTGLAPIRAPQAAASYPSKNSPHLQPYSVTAAVAFMPFTRPSFWSSCRSTIPSLSFISEVDSLDRSRPTLLTPRCAQRLMTTIESVTEVTDAGGALTPLPLSRQVAGKTVALPSLHPLRVHRSVRELREVSQPPPNPRVVWSSSRPCRSLASTCRCRHRPA